jgi:hypothetical protein
LKVLFPLWVEAVIQKHAWSVYFNCRLPLWVFREISFVMISFFHLFIYIGLIAFFIFIFYQTHKNSTSILKLNHFVFIFIFVTILVIIMFFTLKMATLTIKKVNFCQYDISSINSILVTINHLLGCQKSPYLENIYELDQN